MATLKAHGLLIIDQINATYWGLGFVCGTLEKEVKSIVHACLTGVQFLGFSYFVSRAT